MKNNTSFLKLIILYLLITSCTDDNDALFYEDVSQNQETISTNKSDIYAIKQPERVINELIIKFFDTVDITEKYKQSLRKKYEVIKHEACACNNGRLEKWTFGSIANIEKTKDDIAQEGGVEGVDYQFKYPNENKYSNSSPPNHYQSEALITSSIEPMANNKDLVTIAIIDTGINLNKLPGAQSLLYNDSCNNNIFDDNGHGTIVANIIINELKNQSNKYQILPIKAFNKKGKGTTFDILCGYLYAVSKPEVSIINMSFGWYRYPSTLLSKFIGANQDILHLTSAGNIGNNNDGIHHFPSSITHINVLSIGSYHEKNNYFTKSDFSNHGKLSVDFLSKGENIVSPFNGRFVKGTSYATPYVAAQAMKYYLLGDRTPQQIIFRLRANIHPLTNGNISCIRYGNGVIR